MGGLGLGSHFFFAWFKLVSHNQLEEDSRRWVLEHQTSCIKKMGKKDMNILLHNGFFWDNLLKALGSFSCF